MWPRFIGFSLLNWMANIVGVMLLLRYVMPDGLSPYVLSLGPWLLSFVLAFIFAELVFRKQLPGIRETATLIGVWLVVGYTMHVFYALYFFGTVRIILLSPDIHITYLFEIAAILLASYTTRRKRIRAALGEGLAE